MSGRVWYTSDLHFGHRMVAEKRGFASADEHDRQLMHIWNDSVSPADTVWVLGDVCLSAGALNRVGLLNGTKHLIAGNHDACWPGHRDAHKKQRGWLLYFESVQAFARRRVAGTEFMLSHFPYVSDRTPKARHMQYRLRDEGLLLLHGHTHSREIYNRERPRQVHVGWDAWDGPVDQEQITELLGEVRYEEQKFIPKFSALPERVCECC